jgi:GTPase Era involved in 16S rRNA processing
MNSFLALAQYFIILITLLNNSCCNQNKFIKNKLILLVGPTRAGKSCFINTITGKNLTVVGHDSGESTTKLSHSYESKIDGFPEKSSFSLVDTMGLDDTEDSEFSDPMVISNTTLEIRNITRSRLTDVDAILVFESLTNDYNKLDNTLKKLKAAYGQDISEHIIVILNKNPKPHPKRLAKLKKIIESHNVKYLHWKSGCSSKSVNEIYYDQMNYLHNLILNIKVFSREKIQNLVDTLLSEGRNVLKKTSQNNMMHKLKKYVFVGSAGLAAIQYLNLPAFILTNIATLGFNELIVYLENNENFLISLAVEERIKESLKKKDDL